MRFGVHVSAAGGLDRAPERAANLGCETMQIFIKNNRQWAIRRLRRGGTLPGRSQLQYRA